LANRAPLALRCFVRKKTRLFARLAQIDVRVARSELALHKMD
jgi:hypothetical protein